LELVFAIFCYGFLGDGGLRRDNKMKLAASAGFPKSAIHQERKFSVPILKFGYLR